MVAAIVFTIIKALSKEVNFVDLCLVIVTALAILLFVLFCFQPGNGSWLSILKWTGTAIILIASVALSVLRSLRVK